MVYLTACLFVTEMAEKIKKAEQEKIEQENATFAPKTNKSVKKSSLNHFNVGRGSVGL